MVRRFLDTKDKALTKSLQAHALQCCSLGILEKSEEAPNIASARDALKKADLRDGSITAVFERTGKGKLTYSHRPHTKNETWYDDLLLMLIVLITPNSCEIVKWVTQSMRPFSIVEDDGFKMLMKTGRPNLLQTGSQLSRSEGKTAGKYGSHTGKDRLQLMCCTLEIC